MCCVRMCILLPSNEFELSTSINNNETKTFLLCCLFEFLLTHLFGPPWSTWRRNAIEQ